MNASKCQLPGIVFLTHADSDLIMLRRALQSMPPGFPNVVGINLQTLEKVEDVACLHEANGTPAQVILARLLGPAQSAPGFGELVALVRRRGLHLIAVSGTGDPDPELARVSTVSLATLRDTLAYFQAGGAGNMAQLLRFLSDHLLLTGFGYDPPVALPEHGIYHPALREKATLADWLARRRPDSPSVGITFYRAHWMSGNTRFVDALVEALESRGINALPVFTSSLRAQDSQSRVASAALGFFVGSSGPRIDALINTTSFAMGDISPGPSASGGWSMDALMALDVPVFQAVASGMTRGQWESSTRGLNPIDTAMNVVIPEFDGRIITVPISFKQRPKENLLDPADYQPLEDRVERVVGIASRFARLRRLENGDKRIAFILTNSAGKASQIGNAVGLDAPASLLAILKAMQAHGYRIGALPRSGDELMHQLIDRCCYDEQYLSAEHCARAIGRVSAKQYQEWFAELPQELRRKMEAQWGPAPGKAYRYDGQLVIAGIELGNAFVAIQPPRGYGMDPDAIYHQPDLPPTHHYYAFYRWLRDVWGADALVHVGKHGTLEWLPGKGVGLSAGCFPDAALGDLPLFYPFILNDPGEGSQAKRRAHAVVIDHLIPPMTTADTYGVLAELAQLVDEYHQVETLDPAKLPILQQQAWDLIRKASLEQDLRFLLGSESERRGGEGGHDGSPCLEHISVPESSARDGAALAVTGLEGIDFARLIEEIDGYLCELGAAQIRGGLHVLGEAPEGPALVDMLCSLTRLPNLDVPGLYQETARCLGLDFDFLLQDKGRRLEHVPSDLARLAGRPVVTKADALEVIDAFCHKMIALLERRGFDASCIDQVMTETLGVGRDSSGLGRTLQFVCLDLVPNLRRTGEEIANLLRGLDGGYVPAGPSGSPTRGMAHVLPTGRNFYSVDPRALPSQAAWRIGRQLAHEVIARHLKETGRYPESVSISVWGTSAMRTHGDDVAQILALLGVRPLWQAENRRVKGVEVIPLAQLGRPRIDVTTRISGFFRDAFPHLIDLIDEAVNMVVVMDEPCDCNFVRKHYLADVAERLAQGLPQEAAERRARYRIFGSKPGSYGAGILPLIQEKNWAGDADFALAYINWGGYAYTRREAGTEAKEDFRRRLAAVEVALHNQDNREHDIFDSDDYLQFHGGMIATIRSLSGREPRRYFGDTHDPARAVVRDLREEALRVFRSRVVNPKWLESIRRHGYKGGLELAATVDYLFGYDATARVMDDWMYEQVARVYALDPQMGKFFSESNPWALNAIAERLLEAAQRKMWADPSPQTLAALQAVYLASEAQLEARGERSRKTESAP